MRVLLPFLSCAYRLLLRLYPESFRTNFGEEMQDVYEAATAEAAHQGPLPLFWVCLRELLDLPLHLFQEHWASLRQRWADSQTYRPIALESSSWTAAFAGMLLFLVAGLELALGEIPHYGSLFAWLPSLRTILLLGLLVLSAVGFGVGWIQDFPRWSYPYVMLMVMFNLYLMNVTTPELRIFTFANDDLWGWRVWIPGATMAVTALIISRSLHPAVRLFANVWEDWTLLTWGMFGAMPLLIAISFDKVDKLYSLPFILFLTVVMASTAIAYLRSRRTWQQLAALLVGILITVSVVAVAPTLYWPENGWGSLPGLLLGAVVVVATMFSPVFIGLLHRSLDLLRAV